MGRVCAACRRDLPLSSYTANQYSRGIGVSRCAPCVHAHHTDLPSPQQSNAGRYNRSHRANYKAYDLDNPFSEGSFRWVARGKYVGGERDGQPCVCKWFKTGAVFAEDFFDLDVKASDKALQIVNLWNQLGVITRTVKINVPEVWTESEVRHDSPGAERVLQEPFIEDYVKFNSNTGWVGEGKDGYENTWSLAMQALSHFSYHVSGGNYVLCDLQGGVYQDSVVLSDPVIISRTREYGVTDLGARGISSFFSQHSCNIFCRSSWTGPADQNRYFRVRDGTTMVRHTIPAAMHRVPGTGRIEEEADDGYYY